MDYSLPTYFDINGTRYEIRSDFRPALDIIEAMNDAELSPQEKVFVCLGIFYKDIENMKREDVEEAAKNMMYFISGGAEASKKRAAKIMDWQQDFPLIVGAINRVLGKEVRAEPYLHWWTFLAAYKEIGECTFTTVCRIRNKRNKGKKLEKDEQEFYYANRDLVEFKTQYTESEKEFLRKVAGLNA